MELWLGGLAATLGRHEAADEHFAAASAIHEREGVRLWEAYNQRFWAGSLLERDREQEAREHAERAAALAGEHGYETVAASARELLNATAGAHSAR